MNKLPKVEIVTHCQSMQRPWYSTLLHFQLSHFHLFPPTKCDLVISVCCSISDKETYKTIRHFGTSSSFSLTTMLLDLKRVGRRAIGRNFVSKLSEADYIWYTDCDYLIEGNCLDALVSMEWPKDASLVFPKYTKTQNKKYVDVNALKKLKEYSPLVAIDVFNFIETQNHRAIGGIQIVQGNFAREHGYIPSHKQHQKPVEDGSFVSCKCDRSFRKQCSKLGKIVPVDLPGVYRLGHPKRRYSSK